MVGPQRAPQIEVRTQLEACPAKAVTYTCIPQPDADVPLGERLNKMEERGECLEDIVEAWYKGHLECVQAIESRTTFGDDI